MRSRRWNCGDARPQGDGGAAGRHANHASYTDRYRGTTLAEMDLDAILTWHPGLAVVDELAHTNAPGSRHPKRYQDVLELLDAGIDIYTTLNVQHVGSRSDTVRQITGAPVSETFRIP